MIKDKYLNKSAIVLFGGTSCLKYLQQLQFINWHENILILEGKIVDPIIVKNNLKPNYIFAPFAEKLKDNYFQNLILRSIVANINIKKFIKNIFFSDVDYIVKNFDNIYELWKPEKGLHKKIKFKDNKFLKQSPFTYFDLFPDSKVIINKSNYINNFSGIKLTHDTLAVDLYESNEKKIDQYLNPSLSINNEIKILNLNFLNSYAIYLYPLLIFWGFKKIYLLGNDMDFFGNISYPTLKFFKSYFHFILFLFQIRNTLNGNFKMNFPIHYRPRNDYQQQAYLFSKLNVDICRVVNPSHSYRKIDHINHISYENFFKELNVQ